MIANTHTHTPLKEYRFQYYYDGTMSSGLINKSGKTLYYRGLQNNTDYGQYTCANGSMLNIDNMSIFSVYDLIDGKPVYIFTRSIKNDGEYDWFGLNANGQYVSLEVSTTTTNDFSVYTKK